MMQYTDTEAALIGGLISNYFFQPAVAASLKDVNRFIRFRAKKNTACCRAFPSPVFI